MCDLDLEPCTVWRETPRKARKPHECDACGSEISAGDAYLDHANLFDGRWSWEKMCAFCWCIREDFAREHGSFQPSGLFQHLADCITENDFDDDGWRPLFAALKRRWRVSSSGRAHLAERVRSKVNSAFDRAAGLAGYRIEHQGGLRPIPFVWPVPSP